MVALLTRVLSGAVLAVVGAACASAPGPGRPGAVCGSGVITSSDAAAVGTASLTAYDVVERLCPLWLNNRGVASLEAPVDVVVYVDDVRVGDRSGLRLVSAGDIASVRRLSPTDATVRFGRGHGAGALLVATRRR